MNRTAAMVLVLMAASVPFAARGVMDSMHVPPQSAGKANKGDVHHAHGVVDKVDPRKGRITITHDPIPSLGMDKMTMDFNVEDKSQLEGIKAGSNVDFDIRKQGATYRIVKIAPAEK